MRFFGTCAETWLDHYCYVLFARTFVGSFVSFRSFASLFHSFFRTSLAWFMYPCDSHLFEHTTLNMHTVSYVSNGTQHTESTVIIYMSRHLSNACFCMLKCRLVYSACHIWTFVHESRQLKRESLNFEIWSSWTIFICFNFRNFWKI